MACLGSIGMGIIYGLKVNLHVAIVTMVNHTAITAINGTSDTNSTTCSMGGGEQDSTSSKDDGPFVWDSNVQGLLLSSYFWGYMVSQLPGGCIAEHFSAKWVMFFAVAINIGSILLSPLFATFHYGALLALRILQGIGGGVTFPAMHVMLARWAPPSERSVMSSIVYAGTALGTVVSNAIYTLFESVAIT